MSSINTNNSGIAIARQLNNSQELLGRTIARLSSGSKIVDPSDDANGLAASEKLGAQNRRVRAATTNVQSANSYLQAANGFLTRFANTLSRLSDLAALSNDATKSSTDVALYKLEFTALQDQLRSTIGGTTAEIGGTADISTPSGTFNGNTLFGPNSAGVVITIGESADEQVAIPETNLRQGAVLNLIQQDGAGAYTFSPTSSAAITTINDALQQIADEQAIIGSSQTRLSLAAATLQVESQNLTSAVSRLSDLDVAIESTRFAKYNILVQSSTSILAQANQSPSSVLQLLQN